MKDAFYTNDFICKICCVDVLPNQVDILLSLNVYELLPNRISTIQHVDIW